LPTRAAESGARERRGRAGLCAARPPPSVGVVATPCLHPTPEVVSDAVTHQARTSVGSKRSTSTPMRSACVHRCGSAAGPGWRTARRASARTRPDAPPPRPATARPSDSQAPQRPRHRPGRLSPEVPHSQGSRCERDTTSAPAVRKSRDARRCRPSAADADELGAALWHELRWDAGAGSRVAKVLADQGACGSRDSRTAASTPALSLS
jgi:hypothetical protein